MIPRIESTLKSPHRGKSPYEEGQSAFREGLDVTDNPYDKIRQDVPSEEWERGWYDARRES